MKVILGDLVKFTFYSPRLHRQFNFKKDWTEYLLSEATTGSSWGERRAVSSASVAIVVSEFFLMSEVCIILYKIDPETLPCCGITEMQWKTVN